jgi:hypothetical protein
MRLLQIILVKAPHTPVVQDKRSHEFGVISFQSTANIDLKPRLWKIMLFRMTETWLPIYGCTLCHQHFHGCTKSTLISVPLYDWPPPEWLILWLNPEVTEPGLSCSAQRVNVWWSMNDWSHGCCVNNMHKVYCNWYMYPTGFRWERGQ